MKYQLNSQIWLSLTVAGVALVTSLIMASCGKENAGNVTIQSAPLSGPNAASFGKAAYFADLMSTLMGIQEAWASVSSFSTFKACNDTLKFIDSNGNVVKINGAESAEVGKGLLTFSPSSTAAMTIGSLNIPTGTEIKEIDITFAAVPSVCGGATYAVQFDDGVNGAKDITQNTAFKFQFSTPKVIADGETLSLLFGSIVNQMVSLGSGLNNSSIQGVSVGQAQ